MKTIEQYKNEVMRNGTLSDMQKLQMVFDTSKEKLKGNDPQLYYAIIGVLDHEKCGAKQTKSYFEILNELSIRIGTDYCITEEDKKAISNQINILFESLWRYSD